MRKLRLQLIIAFGLLTLNLNICYSATTVYSLTNLLDVQPNPLRPVITLLGFLIAMGYLFMRNAKKNKKEEETSKDEENKMK